MVIMTNNIAEIKLLARQLMMIIFSKSKTNFNNKHNLECNASDLSAAVPEVA